jgi:hypothetical protein
VIKQHATSHRAFARILERYYGFTTLH